LTAERLHDVSNQFDYVTRVLGKTVARRMPITYMKLVLAILRGENGRPTTAMNLVRSLPAFYDDVAAVVKIMKRQKWIDVVPTPHDRRQKHLVLSAKGQVIARELAKLSNLPDNTAVE
jgi:hypothetical protein